MIEEITSPPFLDDTAQEMVTKLQAIANNINNNAGQVSYSNTSSQLQAETVQTAIDEVKGITDTISSSLAQKVTNESNSELKMKIGTINTSSSLTFTAQIAFLVTFGTGGQQGIYGCRSGTIQDIITAGSSISHSVSGTTYTFNNTSASVGARYLLAYI